MTLRNRILLAAARNLFNFATSVTGYYFNKGADSFVSGIRNSYSIFGMYTTADKLFVEGNDMPLDPTKPVNIAIDIRRTSGVGKLNYIGLAQYKADKTFTTIVNKYVTSSAITEEYTRISITITNLAADTAYGILALQASNDASNAIYEVKNIEVTNM